MAVIPKKARVIPYGYKVSEINPNYLEPIELELKALEKAKEYIKSGYTYRATQDWLMHATGRKISNCGFYKLINEREDIRRPPSASRKAKHEGETEGNSEGTNREVSESCSEESRSPTGENPRAETENRGAEAEH